MEVIKCYSLLNIGVGYNDQMSMPADMADNLLLFHKEVKSYEEKQNKKSMRK